MQKFRKGKTKNTVIEMSYPYLLKMSRMILKYKTAHPFQMEWF